jgi:hypothetical protein
MWIIVFRDTVLCVGGFNVSTLQLTQPNVEAYKHLEFETPGQALDWLHSHNVERGLYHIRNVDTGNFYQFSFGE